MPYLSQSALGAILTVLAAFLFAGKTVLAKLAYQEGMDPLSLICMRMIIAGAVFAGILAANVIRGKWRPQDLPPSKWALVAVLGVFGYYLCSFLDFSGLYYIDASLGRMILFLYPTLTVLINAFISRTRISFSTWTALAVSYFGLLMMMGPHLSSPGPGFLKGCGLIFLSAAIYACYLVTVDHKYGKAGMPMLISLTMMCSVMSVMAHYGILRDFRDLLDFTPRAYLWVVILSLFATVVPVYAMSAGIALLGASKAAIYNMTGPIMTLALSALALGERPGWMEITGMVLIILGVSRSGVKAAHPAPASEKTAEAAMTGVAEAAIATDAEVAAITQNPAAAPDLSDVSDVSDLSDVSNAMKATFGTLSSTATEEGARSSEAEDPPRKTDSEN
jgi:drug/metabolite transporter (DMT)-like permease